MERVIGFEPTTFSLGSCLPQVVTPRSDATSLDAVRPLSPPLSLESASGDPIRLARELLAQAESVSDPRALIAAAKQLLNVADPSGRGGASNVSG